MKYKLYWLSNSLIIPLGAYGYIYARYEVSVIEHVPGMTGHRWQWLFTQEDDANTGTRRTIHDYIGSSALMPNEPTSWHGSYFVFGLSHGNSCDVTEMPTANWLVACWVRWQLWTATTAKVNLGHSSFYGKVVKPVCEASNREMSHDHAILQFPNATIKGQNEVQKRRALPQIAHKSFEINSWLMKTNLEFILLITFTKNQYLSKWFFFTFQVSHYPLWYPSTKIQASLFCCVFYYVGTTGILYSNFSFETMRTIFPFHRHPPPHHHPWDSNLDLNLS